MIEVPVVAEGALDIDIIRKLSPFTDFFGIGEEIWRAEDPAARLAELRAAF
jgi:thiamine-phosphate pyrophosphorylase